MAEELVAWLNILARRVGIYDWNPCGTHAMVLRDVDDPARLKTNYKCTLANLGA